MDLMELDDNPLVPAPFSLVLLVAAQVANVADEVLDLVASRYGGKDYQKAIVRDLKRLPENLREVLREAVEGRRRNRRS